ncbi:MAG TPA: translation elongation factor Ts [Polyangiaceae bacterium]|nr:translation elongation factor Ts [Polyangiaceae bacterium]
MTQVNMSQVKELRDRTQAGLNDCRAALVEASGDMEAAVGIILKKGLAKSAKRAGALATEGIVTTAVAADGKSGVIVEVNIQTDFAARNEEFLAFVNDVVAIASKAPAGADLGAQKSGAGTLEERRQALVGKLGENINVRRWDRVEVAEAGVVHSYVHMGGKIGVLLAVETSKPASSPVLSKFVEETAMQVAAMAPQFVSAAGVPEAEKNKQRLIFDAQLQEEGKPEAARPKIIEGKIAKWMKEITLLDQPSVLDGDKTVEQVRAAAEKELGGSLKIKAFVRYERGEGLAAPQGPDFADEARRMAGQG